MDLQRISELGFEKMSIWHRFVLVMSFSRWWNVVIVIQCFWVFILSTSRFAFDLYIPYLTHLMHIADILYALEVVFTVSYIRNKRMRKLRFVKRRHWIFIMVDAISLVPVELLFTYYYLHEEKDHTVIGILTQNRSLRIYRLLLLESSYMSTVIRTPMKYVIFSFFLFFTKSIIIGHVLTCIWFNVEKEVSCDKKKFNCYLWYEINMVNVVILNWTGPEKMFSRPMERLIVTCAMLLGFFLIFGYIFPYAFYFSLLIGYKYSSYVEKRERLRKFLKNSIRNGDLKLKIQSYFNYMWSEGEKEPGVDSALKNIPVSIQKEIFSDIYWEAFRHSDLFREASRNFKRTLSLQMATEYHHNGEVVYYKGQEISKMVFVVQGILQVMAKENEESPLLSFSSGTVFGELSLFLSTRSQAIVKCKGYCELQILSRQAVRTALRDYPKDRKFILQKVHRRLLIARHTQWRKKKFKEDQKLEMLSFDSSYFTVEDCVKWLKRQWRRCWESHKRNRSVVRARAEGTRLRAWRLPIRPDINIEFISNYLDLIVLSNPFEEKKGVVCLNLRFPWSIDPSTQFIRIWYYIVLLTSLVPALAYPVCTAWFDRFPFPVYLISYLVTLIYIIDFGLIVLTAVRTKHVTITKLSEVLRHNLHRATFYLDIIAAIPYQLYIVAKWDVTKDESYKVGLLLHLTMVKSYVLFRIEIPLGPYVDVLTILKNCLIFFLLLFWFSELIQLHSIVNVFNINNDWIARYIGTEDNKFLTKNFVSVFRALVTVISVPSSVIYADENIGLVFSCIAKYFFFGYGCYFMGVYFASVVVKKFSSEMFYVLKMRLRYFLKTKKVSKKIISRIMKSIQFQWDYNKGDYISNRDSVFSSMPFNLQRQVYLETTYKTLQSTRLFQGESVEFLLEVLEHSDCVAVPPGFVLVTYGHINRCLTIINRGYCQLNSHLIKDITANLGRASILGPGGVFPILSTFCNVPAAVSVVTVTDCELIVIDVNNLISVMIKHNFFKDVVDVMQEEGLFTRLMASRPALMRVSAPDVPANDDAEHDSKFLNRTAFFNRANIFAKSSFLRYWVYFYVFYLVLECVLWPCCFGLLVFQFHILIPFFVASKIFVLAQMGIQWSMPYFNQRGLIVTDPLHTLFHYLRTNFAVDVIRILPVFPIYYYGFADPYQKPNFFVVLVASIQCFLGLMYILGCINYVGNFISNNQYTRIVKVFLMMGLIFNWQVNASMFLYSVWTFGGPRRVIGFYLPEGHTTINPNFIRKNNVLDYYLLISYWTIANLSTNYYEVQLLSGLQLYLSYVYTFFGTIISFYTYVTVSSSSIFTRAGAASFREEFTSLMKFLVHEKADDKTMERMNLLYNCLKAKAGEEDLGDILTYLPLYLLEELWYPLYRPTFIKNSLLEDADEGFFRVLATQVSSVFFTRGSIIIFKNEVQSYIYFVHRGKCFVYDWFITLDMGSIVGDLHQTGLMQNKVYALTNVEMLKISSEAFFTIINNFGDLEANFLHGVKKTENFVKSDVYRESHPLRPVDSKDAVNAFELKKKEIGFEDESYFEDPQNDINQAFLLLNYKPKDTRNLMIYPYSWKMKVFTYVSYSDVVLTTLLIPCFASFGGLSKEAFIIFGVLDFVWLLVMIATFFVGLLDQHKGDVVTNYKFVAKNYVKNGFFLDFLSLLPFELIPVAVAKGCQHANDTLVVLLRAVRYLRLYNFYKYRRNEFGPLKTEYSRNCFFFFILFTWALIVSTSVFVKITKDPKIVAARDPFSFQKQQLEAALFALSQVVSFFSSANVPCITPTTRAELLHFNITILVFFYLKGKLISRILSVIYFRNTAAFQYQTQVSRLRSYLKKKETSPILIERIVNYKTNLFRFGRSENMPGFLRRVPTPTKIMMMKEFFVYHLTNCPLFEGIDKIFLDQLIGRAKREVYFPGEKIVEQGDVDHKFYFIHTGEVYVINQTKDKAYVEFVVGRMSAGEFFGEAQGLWFSKPHVYTYRGRTLVEIIVLQSDDWSDLRITFPEITLKIFEKAKALRYI